MDLIPHIDIIEPERIKALLAEERNFDWRALDSETLDSWTPDLGLTAYPRPSILRAGRGRAFGHVFDLAPSLLADHSEAGGSYRRTINRCADSFVRRRNLPDGVAFGWRRYRQDRTRAQ